MAGARGLSPAAAALVDTVAARLPEAPIVVALSGGADSAALAWAVSQRHAVRAVSVYHGLESSAALMEAAAAIADRLGIPHRTVPASLVTPTETALREARYSALEGAGEAGEVIATGHTLDDQAETVLGNLLRGSGVSGLGGIPARRGRYVRPMLTIRRDTVRTVAQELSLPFRDDPMNDDDSVRRNRLRRTTIPSLVDEYNPQLVVSLGRLARSAVSDDQVLEDRAGRVPLRLEDGAALIPAASLRMLPAAVAARVARRALRAVRGPHSGGSVDVEAVMSAVGGERRTLEGAIEVEREGPWVVVGPRRSVSPQRRVLEAGPTRFGAWTIGFGDDPWTVGRFDALVPSDSSLAVRVPRRGDRIDIGSGSKPVTVALSEAGIPPRRRLTWPVVEAGGTIVWIPGVRSVPARGSETVRLWARRTG